jgi:hypothetical protein
MSLNQIVVEDSALRQCALFNSKRRKREEKEKKEDEDYSSVFVQ